MALSYLPVDRDQLFLLPPDMRAWLPDDHLVWLVLDVVERLDTALLHARHPNDGAGRRAYDPDMLLGLLVYAYCTGERSSRRIERLCQTDVAFRVLSANAAPDHTTIARFRQDHADAARQLFVDVLVVCAEAGLASVGVVAVDGTKMEADAALRANRSEAQLAATVAAMLAEATDTDATEDRLFGPDANGGELPAGLAQRGQRGARLDAAMAVLQRRKQDRDAADSARRAAREQLIADAAARGERPNGRLPNGPEGLAQAEARLAASIAADAARVAAWEARRQAGRHPGPYPGESRPTKRARKTLEGAKARAGRSVRRGSRAVVDRVNVTDPDSQIMHTAKQQFVQGYNAQAAVNRDGIVVAADVTNHSTDFASAQPMMALIGDNLAAAGITTPVGTLLFDAGYYRADNLTAPGPDRLIASTKSSKLRAAPPAEGDEPTDPVERNNHRLRTEDGAALYALRQHTVEPAFAHIKTTRRIRRFSRRGLDAVRAEWDLITASANILTIHRRRHAIT